MKKTTRHYPTTNMNAKLVHFTLLVASVQCVTKLSQYRNLLLPINVHSDWKPVEIHNLTCPKPRLDWTVDFHQLATEQVYRLKDLSLGEVKGYLCHKAQWITRCEYRWYLSQVVSRRVKEETPTQAECEEAIHHFDEGREMSGSFPPEACFWNAINDESETKIILTVHDLTYDPYTDMGLDSNLVGGACKSRFCKTTHSSVMWIKDPKSQTEPCVHMIAEKLTILSSKQGETGKRWVKTTATPAMSLEKACKLRYCGVEGILLSSGLWFGLPDSSKEHHDNLGIRDNCPTNSEVGVLQPDYFDNSMEFKLEDLQREILCLQLLDKIKLQRLISMFDLQYLRPHNSGFGHVYQVINQTLMSTHAHYAVTTYPGSNSLTRNCLGQYKDSSMNTVCVNWSSWLPMKDGVYQGFNGIIEKDGVILFPEDQLLESSWSPDMFDYIPLNKIHHPFYYNMSEIIHDDIDERLIHDNSTNPGDAISDWVSVANNKVVHFFKQLGESIFIIILIILGANLTYKCVKLCIRWRLGLKSKKTQFLEDGHVMNMARETVFG
uniref:Glycoprotein n=1 Tax=Kanyawara virus TaxID=2014931 RepID=A0A7D4X7B5_9RHAB|nr:glycoprotein [Kanyawara virus]